MKIKINVCLSNAFWLCPHGVKSALFLSYKLSKTEKWNWDTLCVLPRLAVAALYCRVCLQWSDTFVKDVWGFNLSVCGWPIKV